MGWIYPHTPAINPKTKRPWIDFSPKTEKALVQELNAQLKASLQADVKAKRITKDEAKELYKAQKLEHVDFNQLSAQDKKDIKVLLGMINENFHFYYGE